MDPRQRLESVFISNIHVIITTGVHRLPVTCPVSTLHTLSPSTPQTENTCRICRAAFISLSPIHL
ncbi:hypothetical protein C0Q70_19843 [Pomacea canaliculata]|uniref:Uncharacterized protein n=1 Tax=Pomacea canaliculata TaxID=400727 RepID=A0A2T7NDY0_POMCA|nr:hypothetical protein C0Q70_19843 [Pomacea canaliculata]